MVQFFLKELGFASGNGDQSLTALINLLIESEWTGNVRELKATVTRLYAMYQDDLEAMVEDLVGQTRENERARLLRTLESTDWNRSETARLLGVSEGTVRNRIKQYRLSEASATTRIE